jgi:hypothetical protein
VLKLTALHPFDDMPVPARNGRIRVVLTMEMAMRGFKFHELSNRQDFDKFSQPSRARHSINAGKS